MRWVPWPRRRLFDDAVVAAARAGATICHQRQVRTVASNLGARNAMMDYWYERLVASIDF